MDDQIRGMQALNVVCGVLQFAFALALILIVRYQLEIWWYVGKHPCMPWRFMPRLLPARSTARYSLLILRMQHAVLDGRPRPLNIASVHIMRTACAPRKLF